MAITKIDLTNVNDTLEGTIKAFQGYQLTTIADGATLELAGGSVEEIGDFLYQVEGGDLAITKGSLSDGIVFLHIKDDGTGGADAYLSVNPGTWDPNKRGYYYTDGAKVIFAMTKAGTDYTHRGRILAPLDQERAIGEIFGVHPDTLVKPNPYNFSLCNGVETMDTAFISATNDTKTPLMLNNRFLTGAENWDPDLSGSNSHNHQWYKTAGPKLYNSIGGEIDVVQAGRSATDYIQATDASADGLSVDAYTTDIDHKPKYFVVNYYIRIR